MACRDWDYYGDALVEGAYFDAISCMFFDSMGQTVFGLFFFGGMMISVYFMSGTIIMPLVLTLIIGSVIVAFLPSVTLQLIGGVLLIGIAVGGYTLYRRMDTGRGP